MMERVCFSETAKLSPSSWTFPSLVKTTLPDFVFLFLLALNHSTRERLLLLRLLQSLARLARYADSLVPSSSGGRHMDASDRSSSPRGRQLQGPRPPRLAVSKDSHKIRKPPVAPQPRQHLQQQPPAQYHHQQQHHGHHHHQPQQQQQRAPVIIYDASPKVIHTKPGDFMALVQRLTGPGSSAGPARPQFDAAPAGAGAGPSASASAALLPPEFQPREFLLSPTAALSPAARLAAIERSVRPLPHGQAPGSYAAVSDDYYSSAPGPFADVDGLAAALGLTPGRPGILSPVPSALPPAASSGQFSPLPFDPSCFSWLGEMSPFLPSAGARAAGLEPPFAPSPGSQLLLATPTMPSPATVSVLEFFSNFPDM